MNIHKFIHHLHTHLSYDGPALCWMTGVWRRQFVCLEQLSAYMNLTEDLERFYQLPIVSPTYLLTYLLNYR